MAGTIDDPRHLSPHDRIELASGDSAILQVRGTGWGRVDVLAKDNLTINVIVSHVDFGAVAQNRRPPAQLFDVSNFTFIFFYAADEKPHYGVGYSQQWWGLPNYGPVMNGGSFPQPLRPGNAAILLMYTSVSGYFVQLRAGPEDAVKHFRWDLGANPDAHYIVPKEQQTATVSQNGLRVNRERDWTTGLMDVQPGFLRGIGWAQHPGLHAVTGLRTRDVMRIEPSRAPATFSPFPHTPSTGGSTGFSYPRNVDLEIPAKLEMYRHISDTMVGVENEIVGAAFLALPLAVRPTE